MQTTAAFILAAGIGERLDIFETIKPLVKLRGKSLLIWTIERLKEVGVNDIHVIIRPGDTLIKKEMLEYSDDIKFLEQKYSEKGMLGSMLTIADSVSGPFFVSMCDLYFDRNPFRLFQEESNDDVVKVLVSTDMEKNSISGAQEKVLYRNGSLFYPENEEDCNAVEAGIYHFTNRSYADFCKISKDRNIKNTRQAFKAFGITAPVAMEGNQWFDINTPVTLVRTELFLQKKLHPEKKLESRDAQFKELKATAKFDYKKPIVFRVNVMRGIIEKISEYEIIPHEYYYSPHHLIIDRNIYELYGKNIYKQFTSLGYQINKILVDPGEKSKSIKSYAKIAEEILVSGIEKKSIIISVGGGVIKDLAGFLASTLYRGIGFISFPTTVLSQCDAAIALKQGVNGTKGKNLIGSYYAPMKVVVDPFVLLSLNDRFIKDGLAECLKQSFAQDIDFYNYFNNYQGNLKDIDFLEEAVTRAIKLKISSINLDFFEEGFSLVNQYGHEIGHAVEYLSGYKLLHGESVSIGMRVSAEISKIMGIASQNVVDAHIETFEKV